MEPKRQLAEFRVADVRLGRIQRNEGRLRSAQESQLRALEIFVQRDDERGQSEALTELGLIAFHEERHDAALSYHERALALRLKHYGGAHSATAVGYYYLGTMQQAQGRAGLE